MIKKLKINKQTANICQLTSHPWSSINLLIKIGATENPNETVMLLSALILPRFLLNQIIIIFLEVIVKTPCPLNLIKKNRTVINANGIIQESIFKIDLKVFLLF